MRYLTVCRDQGCTRSNDQVTVSSNYLERDDFDLSIPFHSALHYVFVKHGPTVSYSKVYTLRTAINSLLDFVGIHNSRVTEKLKIHAITDLGAEEYRLFESFLRSKKVSVDLAVKLKSAFKKVSRIFDDGFPPLQLPIIDQPNSVPAEPLSDDADRDFYTAMRQEVDLIREKVKFQESLSSALPYDKMDVYFISSDLFALQNGETSDWQIDPARAYATLQVYGLPIRGDVALIEAMREDACSSHLSAIGRTPAEFVVSCLIRNGFLRKRAPNSITFTKLFEIVYATNQDQATLALFIQRQLAWNKESVLAIDKDNFVHPLTEIAKASTVLLISEKIKSQGKGLSYVKPKIVLSNSNSSDPYSAYNLIILAIQLSKSCSDYFYSDPTLDAEDKRRRSPFLFVSRAAGARDCFEEFVNINRISTLDVQKQWNYGVQAFLAKAKIVDNGFLLITGADLQGRLRVTATQSTKNSNKHPIALTALLQGHNSPVTTEVHYDSSAYAKAGRKKRFYEFQEALLARVQGGDFNGLSGTMGVREAKEARFRVFTILGHQRALWACTDSSRPEYPGSTALEPGARCTRLDKCHGCSRVYLLGDSVPFVMERLATLELLVERDETVYHQYSDEIKIWQFVLSRWNDKAVLAEAQEYRLRFEALLPLDLLSLIPYIED